MSRTIGLVLCLAMTSLGAARPVAAVVVDMGLELRSFGKDPLNPSKAKLSIDLGLDEGETEAERSPRGFRFYRNDAADSFRSATVIIVPDDPWVRRTIRLARDPSERAQFVRTPVVYLVPKTEPITFATSHSTSSDMLDKATVDRAIAYFSFAQASIDSGWRVDDGLLVGNISWNYTMTLANACQFSYDTCEEAARRCGELAARRTSDPRTTALFAAEQKINPANIALCLDIVDRVRVKSSALAIEQAFEDVEKISSKYSCDPRIVARQRELQRLLSSALDDLAKSPKPWRANSKFKYTLRTDLAVSHLKTGDTIARCDPDDRATACAEWSTAGRELRQATTEGPRLANTSENLRLLQEKLAGCSAA